MAEAGASFNSLWQQFEPFFSNLTQQVKRALPNFIRWAETIDWIAFSDGRWLLLLVNQVAEEALERTDLDERERQRVSNDLEKFRTDFAEIIKSKEVCEKEIVLRTVERALCIGYAAGVSPAELNDFRTKIEKDVENVKAAKAREGKARKNAPDKAKKLKILEAELDKAPGIRIPMKLLSPRVNDRLREAGFESVNESTLRDWKKELQ